MLRKFATASIIDARMGSDSGFAKGAHRAVFNYIPKPGYLYVRSRAISSRCNDNFDMFPAEEIEKSYLTFIGKPVFVNHNNEDHRRARGVIIDAALHKDLNPDRSPDTWVELLHEVDAVTYPKLAKAILAKEVNRTSMGADVAFSKCSACGNVATSPLEYCAHIPGKKGKRIATGRTAANGKRETQLIFEVCSGLSFFENSLLVEQPADPSAFQVGDIVAGAGLDHLRPSDPAAYRPHNGGGYAVPSGDVFESDLPSLRSTASYRNPGEQFFDLSDLEFGEFGSGVGASLETSSSLDHVSGVSGVGSQGPMRRVVAQRDIARVTNNQPFGNGSDQLGVTPTVRPDGTSLGIIQGQSSVSRVEGSTRPRPTSVRSTGKVDFGQVPFHNGLGSGETPGISLPADHKDNSITGGNAWQKTAAKTTNNSNSIWDLIKQAEMETTPMTVWELIKQADRIGDDLEDLDLWVTGAAKAMSSDESEDYVRKATDGGKGVKNILNLVGQANHAELKSGMKWYDDAHGMAKSITNHYQSQEGHPLSKDSHEAALHKVAGTIGVYSEGTAPAPNIHYASEAIHHGQPIYSHPQYHKGDDGKELKDEKGKKIPVRDESGKHVNHGFLPESEYHGLPTASSAQASKVRKFMAGGKIDDVMKNAHKTRNYSSLIENPNSVNEHGKDRVVVDRHAIAAVMGHQGSSGEVYNGKGSTFLGRASGDKDMHKFRDGNYEHVADMYRDAAHHINNSPEHAHIKQNLQDSGLLKDGERVRGHHVQAIAWIKQKQISDSHNRENSGTQRAIDDFHTHYTNRYGDTGHQPASWQGFAGGDARHGSRRPFSKWAYGETKAPQDVNTLRAENCTVCGSSTAFDGTQCQICGYVSPPRPFGDPDTDTAGANDLRKKTLDSADGTADPNDPDQQLGNQIGDPDVVDQQAEDAEEEQTTTPLTCTNCGTSITPPPPTTSGEPPYPAEGDVCPVCKSGDLAAEGGEGAGEDMDGDGIPDEEEEEQGVPGQEQEDGDDDPEEEESDDEEEEQEPPKKGKK